MITEIASKVGVYIFLKYFFDSFFAAKDIYKSNKKQHVHFKAPEILL